MYGFCKRFNKTVIKIEKKLHVFENLFCSISNKLKGVSKKNYCKYSINNLFILSSLKTNQLFKSK